MQTQLNVAIDIGSARHRVAIGLAGGEPIDEFDCEHTPAGIGEFFRRVHKLEDVHGAEVAVATE